MVVLREFKIPYEKSGGILLVGNHLFLPDLPRTRPETMSDLGHALAYCQEFMRAARLWDEYGKMAEFHWNAEKQCYCKIQVKDSA